MLRSFSARLAAGLFTSFDHLVAIHVFELHKHHNSAVMFI